MKIMKKSIIAVLALAASLTSCNFSDFGDINISPNSPGTPYTDLLFTNACYKAKKVSVSVARDFAKVLAPFAPHLAEEMWQMYGGTESLTYEPWPVCDESKLVDNKVVYPVSFNGKTRFSIEMPVGSTPQQAQEVALAHESAAKWLDGKTPKKVIVVPNKIINIVL